MARPNGADDIDDKILSRIPGFGQEEEDDTEEPNTEDTGEVEEADSSDGDDEGTDTDSTDQSVEATSQQTTATAPEQVAHPDAPTGQLGVDKRGNLVNQQGQIVARAGSERRLYEKSARLDTQLTAAKKLNERALQDLKAAVGELTGMRQIYAMANDMRMSTQEAQLGLRMVDKFKKDPADFFKYILTQMAAAGEDVTKLLPEAGAAAVSPEGIKQLIQQEMRQALGPVRETREQNEQQSRAMREAEQEYNTFVSKYPDVAVHEDVIARLIQDDPNLALDAAYYKLQSFAAQNQLDFNLPLKPQIEARSRSGNTQRPVPQAPQQRQQRPMPNGRGTAPVINNQPRFSADSSWEDIINSTMREHGISR